MRVLVVRRSSVARGNPRNVLVNDLISKAKRASLHVATRGKKRHGKVGVESTVIGFSSACHVVTHTAQLAQPAPELVALREHALAALFDEGVELGREGAHARAQVVEVEVDAWQLHQRGVVVVVVARVGVRGRRGAVVTLGGAERRGGGGEGGGRWGGGAGGDGGRHFFWRGDCFVDQSRSRKAISTLGWCSCRWACVCVCVCLCVCVRDLWWWLSFGGCARGSKARLRCGGKQWLMTKLLPGQRPYCVQPSPSSSIRELTPSFGYIEVEDHAR